MTKNGLKQTPTDNAPPFETWVKHLSYDHLLLAMEFEFDSPEEFDLLQDLMKLQAPPPTPIHPRAVPYKAASRNSATDGRNETERVFGMRFERPRLFQLIERTPSLSSQRSRRKQQQQSYVFQQPRYDVYARKFVTADGQVLSLGCTKEQVEADRDIMLGTRIHISNDKKQASRCSFVPLTDSLSSRSLLRMLKVACRGRFLSKPYPRTRQKFWAPWFFPDTDWFSLPMYLASRFEVGLWCAFQRHDPLSGSSVLQDAARTLNENAIRHALLSAVVKSLRSEMLVDVSSSKLPRDTLAWDLLCESPSRHGETGTDVREALLAADQIPLVELGSNMAQFRVSIQNHLQDLIVAEMQKALLDDFDDAATTTTATPAQGQKSKHKGKKKKKKRKITTQPHPLSDVASMTAIDEEEEEAEDVISQEDVFVMPGSVDLYESIERTKAYVTVWKVIDGLLEKVFDEVGLNDEDEEEEVPFDEAPAAKPASKVAPVTQHAEKATPGPPRGPQNQTSIVASAPNQLGDLPPRHLRMNSPGGYDLFFSFLEPKLEDIPLDADLFDITMPANYGYASRDKSAFVDLFLSQNQAELSHSEAAMASSTVASIASSTEKDSPTEILEDDSETDDVRSLAVLDKKEACLPAEDDDRELENGFERGALDETPEAAVVLEGQHEDDDDDDDDDDGQASEAEQSFDACRSPSPMPPSTPPPQLSPILVSLADLQDMRTKALAKIDEMPKTRQTLPPVAPGSLPNSPVAPTRKPLVQSLSKEDFRKLNLSEDLQRGTGTALRDPKLSYRSAAAKAVEATQGTAEVKYAQSENALEMRSHGHEMSDRSFHHAFPPGPTEVAVSAKDSASTLGSTGSHRRESEEVVALRDERNSFRDMCLTLGAEVAKLKNLLAIQTGSSVPSFVPLQASRYSTAVTTASSDKDFMAPFFQGIPQANSIAAMSDAGVPRGDQDSAVSEDGTDFGGGVHDSGRPRAVHVRRISSSVTAAESDISTEQNVNGHDMVGLVGFRLCNHDITDSVPVFGMHSRLTRDIVKFLDATSGQLRKQDKRKNAAVERLTRLATAVWPRAQVKIYGSHVTGLCLPSSDLDFVICLPAVHKNAPAVAPGVLEGRNAINESAQKLLARKLKGESWIDPRSIKLIEHTVVPIVKVATKDTRARTLQLDISFDGPEHHGLAAIEFVSAMMQDLPLAQPLVLILKQFLLDRGLLTAYTGGLSSYCLFLMVARFLQEQPSSWDDCGSLLMAFLDFYGNNFDPRATGISVARRQYFARPNYAHPPAVDQQMWPAIAHQPSHVASPTSSGPPRPDFLRRHSFTDKASIEGNKGSASSVHGTTSSMRPPRFQSSSSSTQHHAQRHMPEYKPPTVHGPQFSTGQSGRPYTFDPLFVEDPLSAANNVGRNAFRIFQVQRAFSDAHRALVASLEWDIHSSQENDDSEYPLLNCLLQSEDMFYELEETK